MLDSNSDSAEPCGTPCSLSITTPSGNTTLAFSNRPISPSSRRSPTRYASSAVSRWWQTRSKEDTTHCHLDGFPATVRIVRARHPLQGRSLELAGWMRRRRLLDLILVPEDGSRLLVPAKWTDLEGHAEPPATAER